jgi:hypothetical protein
MKAFIETKGPWDGGIGEGFLVLACGNVILLCVCGCYEGRHRLLSLKRCFEVRNGKFDHFLVSQVLTPVVGMYHAYCDGKKGICLNCLQIRLLTNLQVRFAVLNLLAEADQNCQNKKCKF